ncbi:MULTISPECIES: hypothetical protein [Bacillus cereus group]|uniref:Phr family secreted Rap phosphatase inhibitor n=1 Tax=Bacillus thuringiensis serovar toumanoffi TaxID=180862 RepID=A0ABD5I8N7_BACTU|nr:hypothetical protein [Bacillus thuringiensis]KIP27913.1 hypothetical protein BG10_4993 [Bacillus thuringiensis serovar morrisoni]MCR6783682.1 hypothetical protein [Bacillus thuringiensis]MCR6862005.1 hypothetical protein [Bacillus thuringiensis]MCR6869556.1 hypothetical protein [Bacillus thuringiensis]MCT6947920.1 hypothetical protein [Bacillus thuringiensis]
MKKISFSLVGVVMAFTLFLNVSHNSVDHQEASQITKDVIVLYAHGNTG